jgi:hypothetical protein
VDSEPQAAPEAGQRQDPPAPKLAYQPPRLSDLGPVEDVTEQGKGDSRPIRTYIFPGTKAPATPKREA